MNKNNTSSDIDIYSWALYKLHVNYYIYLKLYFSETALFILGIFKLHLCKHNILSKALHSGHASVCYELS